MEVESLDRAQLQSHIQVITHRDPVLLTLQSFLGLFSQHLPVGPVSLSQDPQHRLGFFNLPHHYQPPCRLQKQTRPATGRVVGCNCKALFLWMKGWKATTSEGLGGWRRGVVSVLRATLETKMAEPGQR